MTRKPKKPSIPPPFSSDSARRAQPLAVAKRRATDELLRASLADMLPAMPARLRREVAELLPIRQVERLRLAVLRR
jgi:hypothetical protein